MPSCHWKRNDTQRGSEASLPSQITLSISENICFMYNRFQRIILGIVCYRPIGLKFTKDADLHVHMSARQGNVSPNLGFTAESPAIVFIHICHMEPTGKRERKWKQWSYAIYTPTGTRNHSYPTKRYLVTYLSPQLL
jgi:hypothetical protein